MELSQIVTAHKVCEHFMSKIVFKFYTNAIHVQCTCVLYMCVEVNDFFVVAVVVCYMHLRQFIQ